MDNEERKLSAYDRAVALKIAKRQSDQRAVAPRKVAQNLLREFCGKGAGWGGVMDPFAAAKLVELVEEIIVAERAGTMEESHD